MSEQEWDEFVTIVKDQISRNPIPTFHEIIAKQLLQSQDYDYQVNLNNSKLL